MAVFTGFNFEKLFFRKNKKSLNNMIKGYKEMGRINIELAEGVILLDNEALEDYEQFLAECEQCDSKKRGHILR